MSSWNSSRNPKELKEMVASTEQCVQEEAPTVIASLSKLRGLADDDKTQNALLRSRIDDQSQLIMILKQRADEAVGAAHGLESTICQLEQARSDAAAAADASDRKYGVLESRFYALSGNHDEMILIKDVYKRENTTLRDANERLRRDNDTLFCDAIVERDATIGSLQSSLTQLRAENESLSEQFRQTREMLSRTEQDKLSESTTQRQKIELLEKQLRDVSTTLKHREESSSKEGVALEAKLRILRKENDELLELTMQRGRLIQEKQCEIKTLQQQLSDAETSTNAMRRKFLDDEAAVSVDVRVRHLNQSLTAVEDRLDSSHREYEAYKKHSKDLLDKEKKLNAKLRHLVS